MTETGRRAHGELEAQVLRTLWGGERPLTAKEIQQALPGQLPAHTTVLTALDRLRGKGDVERAGVDARGIRFAATRTEAEHTGLAMLQHLTGAGDRRAALMRFAGHLGAEDIELLRRAISPDGHSQPLTGP
ncbi:CopY family transcriptional regulator [Aeromicrobium sp. A1-2]|uniref:BlaI/MecI/CopY family transcriptional regulator n=1 Tax=Aeromicrobium sp. A1-2 TaxID=2107713 RepID=UPI000E4892F1|nr:BlaI/MecI/CopY family transcriptional regulator [Aeromicrobium sp. A1-2]AXT86740.1 CopY family transcriptional regulator [Aeromicrobium sp. A1-2]